MSLGVFLKSISYKKKNLNNLGSYIWYNSESPIYKKGPPSARAISPRVESCIAGLLYYFLIKTAVYPSGCTILL